MPIAADVTVQLSIIDRVVRLTRTDFEHDLFPCCTDGVHTRNTVFLCDGTSFVANSPWIRIWHQICHRHYLVFATVPTVPIAEMRVDQG